MPKHSINPLEFLNPIGTMKQMSNVFDAVGLTGLSESIDQPIGQVTSWLNSQTGAGPTGVQQWQANREDTVWQRGVQDMQDAGLNPALMYGSGQPSPANAGSGSNPSLSLSDMLELAALPAKIENLHSQSDFNEASAAEKRSSASLNDQLFAFNEQIQPLKVEAQKLSNALTRDQRIKIKEETKKIGSEIENLAAQTETEATKQIYNLMAAELNQAEAWQIEQLMPYKVAYMEAQTETEKRLASLYAVEAAYKNGLISGGYIDAMCDEMKANARDAAARAAVDEFRSNISTGNAFSWNPEAKAGKILEGIVKGTLGLPLAGFDYLLDKFNVGAFVGATTGVSKAAAGKNVVQSLSGSELDKYGSLIH